MTETGFAHPKIGSSSMSPIKEPKTDMFCNPDTVKIGKSQMNKCALNPHNVFYYRLLEVLLD